MVAFIGRQKKEEVAQGQEDRIGRLSDVPKSRGRTATGDVSGVNPATATGRAVRELLSPIPGSSRRVEKTGKDDEPTGKFKTVLSLAERNRRQQVRSLRAGGPRGVGFGGPQVGETGLTEAVGATQASGRSRVAPRTGGTAGGGTGGGTPTFAVEGNFRSGVLDSGLFTDTTGLSAIDKLNPKR